MKHPEEVVVVAGKDSELMVGNSRPLKPDEETVLGYGWRRYEPRKRCYSP